MRQKGLWTEHACIYIIAVFRFMHIQYDARYRVHLLRLRDCYCRRVHRGRRLEAIKNNRLKPAR